MYVRDPSNYAQSGKYTKIRVPQISDTAFKKAITAARPEDSV